MHKRVGTTEKGNRNTTGKSGTITGEDRELTGLEPSI